MKRFQRVRTRWQEIEIWKSANACEFRAEGAVHAWFHRDRFLTGLAWDLIAASCLLRPIGPPRSVLMLGVAGGTSLRTLRHLLPEAQLTGIELDCELLSLARTHMDINACNAEIIEADAWTWLLQTAGNSTSSSTISTSPAPTTCIARMRGTPLATSC